MRLIPRTFAGKVTRKRPPQRCPAYFRPRLEALEDRLAPASVVTWTGADNNGEWDDANNWQDNLGHNRLPGPNDLALITQAGITVVHDQAVPDSIYGIQSEAMLTLSAGSLAIASPSTVDAGLAWQGGTLTGGGTLTVSAGGALSINSSVVLDGVTLTNLGTATWTAGSIQLDDGATFDNAGTLTMELNYTWGMGYGFGTACQINNSGTWIDASGNIYANSIGTYGGIGFNNSGSMQVQIGTRLRRRWRHEQRFLQRVRGGRSDAQQPNPDVGQQRDRHGAVRLVQLDRRRQLCRDWHHQHRRRHRGFHRHGVQRRANPERAPEQRVARHGQLSRHRPERD
jgi:hypothetical protein